jgi:deoxycytidylate deaminase
MSSDERDELKIVVTCKRRAAIHENLEDWQLAFNAEQIRRRTELQEKLKRILVHAEMDAIISVARANKPGLAGGTLYATTFPCHSCARHIVASGIRRVFYVEPYPKSLALELHRDSVSEAEGEGGKKVVFLQFSGVAPKNMLVFFKKQLTRKDSTGKLKTTSKRSARPITGISLDDLATHEKLVIAEYARNEQDASRAKQATLFDAGY